MIKNQKGFTGLEVVLIILLVAIVAAAGGYVYSQRNQAEVSTGQESKSAVASKISEDDAKKIVEDFYAEYKKKASGDSVDVVEANLKVVVEKYGTSELVDYFVNAQGYDPIFCSQNMPNGNITAKIKSSSKDQAVISVSQKYIGDAGDPSGNTIIENTAVVVKVGDTLKIKTIECQKPTQSSN